MTTFKLRETYVNQMTALRTLELPADGEDAVRRWLNGQGLDLDDVARRPRRNSRGLFTFAAGVGYAIVSADLLGGSADGEAERRFEEETGHRIR